LPENILIFLKNSVEGTSQAKKMTVMSTSAVRFISSCICYVSISKNWRIAHPCICI